jgi:hypothetical protein
VLFAVISKIRKAPPWAGFSLVSATARFWPTADGIDMCSNTVGTVSNYRREALLLNLRSSHSVTNTAMTRMMMCAAVCCQLQFQDIAPSFPKSKNFI